MIPTLLVTGLFVLSGCATVKENALCLDLTQVSKVKVFMLDQKALDEECKEAVVDDNGNSITQGSHYNGCYTPLGHEINVSKECPEALLHEICHASGNDDCAKVNLPCRGRRSF